MFDIGHNIRYDTFYHVLINILASCVYFSTNNLVPGLSNISLPIHIRTSANLQREESSVNENSRSNGMFMKLKHFIDAETLQLWLQ